jgi:site-specific DNA-methyltransferase (adenine-specific)
MSETLIQGDCLEVMKALPDKSVNMILTDLPYGTTQCKWDVIIPLELLWMQYKRIIKANGVIVLTATQPFTSVLIMSNIEMFKYCWVWRKNKSTGFLNAKKQPLRQTEDVAVFYSGQPIYNPIKTIGHKPVNKFYTRTNGEGLGRIGKISGGGATDRYPTNVIDISVVNNDSKDRYHPAQKPVELFEYLIKTYTNEGDLVLDSCAGSGTTGVACRNTNRNYILIEKEPEYIKIIEDRLAIHNLTLRNKVI